METRDLKYFLAYAVPLLTGASIWIGGWGSFVAPVVIFGVLPLVELALRGTTANHAPEAEPRRRAAVFFDWMLYLNVPVLYGLLYYFLDTVTGRRLAAPEWVGMTLSMGISCGALGINVAHELGHRSQGHARALAQVLLAGSLYMHFFIEHNGGHHRHVATPHDPATARRGQSVYAFWWQSVAGGWRSAWRLHARRMAAFQGIQLGLLGLVGWGFGWAGVGAFVGAAVVGFLLLETINYLEHYGLQRRLLRPGVYERVLPCHSWNSNETLGRILLYELTRHSDHHYRASRKYQILRHQAHSPQLPTGYPGMMVVALLPPLWFRVMNPRVDAWTEKQAIFVP